MCEINNLVYSYGYIHNYFFTDAFDYIYCANILNNYHFKGTTIKFSKQFIHFETLIDQE